MLVVAEIRARFQGNADSPLVSSRIKFPIVILREVAGTRAASGKMAQQQRHARETSDEELLAAIEWNYWTPVYREYRRIATRAN